MGIELGNALIALASGIIVALIGVGGQQLAAAAKKRSAEVEARGPEWSAFIAEVREENKKTEDRLNARIARLEERVDKVTNKYQVSLNYLLEWRRKHPRDPLIDALPPVLRPDLPGMWWTPPDD